MATVVCPHCTKEIDIGYAPVDVTAIYECPYCSQDFEYTSQRIRQQTSTSNPGDLFTSVFVGVFIVLFTGASVALLLSGEFMGCCTLIVPVLLGGSVYERITTGEWNYGDSDGTS